MANRPSKKPTTKTTKKAKPAGRVETIGDVVHAAEVAAGKVDIAPPPWRRENRDKLADQFDPEARRLAQAVVEHPEKRLTVIAAEHGMSVSEAKDVLSSPPARDYVLMTMERAGASAEKACKALSEALEAKSGMVVGRTKMADGTFKVDFSDQPDHKVRIHAAELILRVHKFIGETGKDKGGESNISALVLAIREARKARGLPTAQQLPRA